MSKDDTIMKTKPTGEQLNDAQDVLSGRKTIEEISSLTPEQIIALQERVSKKIKQVDAPLVPEVKVPETILETVTKSKKTKTPKAEELKITTPIADIVESKMRKKPAVDLDFTTPEGKKTIYTEDPVLSKNIDDAVMQSKATSTGKDAKLTFRGLTLGGLRAGTNLLGGIRSWLNEIRVGNENIKGADYNQQQRDITHSSVAKTIYDNAGTENAIATMSAIKPKQALQAEDLVGITSPNGHVYSE